MIIETIMPGRVRIQAPAKVNLFLQVLNKRPDGYHNINSLFQAISLHDILELQVVDIPGAYLNVVGAEQIPVDEDNLVVRAANLMRTEFSLAQGLIITLYKQIPVAAGLGGGSSDAAATIEAVNHLFDLQLERPEKIRLGLRLGSDVPFFFSRGQALISGRGEVMEETEFPTDYELILINPGFPLSTPAAYSALKRNLTESEEPIKLPCCRAVEDYIHHLGRAGNDFEAVHRRSYPELDEIREELHKRGAALARMSGSGPTMFGLFTSTPVSQVEDAESWGNWRIYTAAPITLLSQAT